MKKIICRYILLCFPFMLGVILFSFGIYNIVSSLLFFCGGYIALKNIFDYRKRKRNIGGIIDNSLYRVDNNVSKSNNYVKSLKRDLVRRRKK